MDVLQGDLDSFSLADVVRLLATAERTGVLRVERGSLTGRVFFVDGSLTYATTREGHGSIAALARLGTRPERDRRRRNPGGRWPDPARPLILQQISEVLIRLGHGSAGRFWFVEGVVTRAYGSEEIQRFEADEVLDAAAARRAVPASESGGMRGEGMGSGEPREHHGGSSSVEPYSNLGASAAQRDSRDTSRGFRERSACVLGHRGRSSVKRRDRELQTRNDPARGSRGRGRGRAGRGPPPAGVRRAPTGERSGSQ